MNIKEFVEQNIAIDGKIVSSRATEKWFIKHGHSEKLEQIFKETQFLTEGETLGTRLKIVLLGFTEYKKCLNCSNNIPFKKVINHSAEFCSIKCASSHVSTRNKVKTAGRSNSIKNKKSVLNSIEDLTSPKHFSEDWFYNNNKLDLLNEIKEKTLFIENESIFNKVFAIKNNITSRKKCECCGKVLSFNNQRAGKIYCSSSCSQKMIRNKLSSTKRNRDNENNKYYYLLKNGTIDTSDLFIKDIIKKYDVSLSFIHKNNISYKSTQGIYGAQQKEVADFIRSIYTGEVIENTKKVISPLELDIYIPEHNLAIEFDGVYWHSEKNGGKDRNYHLNKTRLCEEQGIQLLHIFDNEWLTNKELWQSVIMAKLGLSNRIYARKCEIVEVSSEEANVFLQDNHLQGKCQSSIRYGLVYENNLVALLTMGKNRYSNKADWELIRFCSLKNTTVVGGFSKLLKHFTKNNKGSILSYANKRWSNGDVYSNNGFKLESISSPNYFYTKDFFTLESRQKYQKHKLSSILSTFDNKLSEWDNMVNNQFDRIWDCGNLVYIL